MKFRIIIGALIWCIDESHGIRDFHWSNAKGQGFSQTKKQACSNSDTLYDINEKNNQRLEKNISAQSKVSKDLRLRHRVWAHFSIFSVSGCFYRKATHRLLTYRPSILSRVGVAIAHWQWRVVHAAILGYGGCDELAFAWPPLVIGFATQCSAACLVGSDGLPGQMIPRFLASAILVTGKKCK